VRKRKARTEVSSSSDTDSSDGEREAVKKVEEVEKPQKKERKEKKDKKPKNSTPVAVSSPAPQETTTTAPHVSPPPPAQTAASPQPTTQTHTTPPPDTINPDEAFSALFLRKLTSELGDDLDKVREAKDFTDRSLPMLILALKQGERLFSLEEKRRFVWAVEEGDKMVEG
jgi:ribosome assembly protein 3